ncbi:CDP-alcohol phosphatidyltransferase family protein, partial [Candidatus Uhrbacteria bacterium]|nr:CDP-alcohol phosphatidyltransferase family protein [Candidatus Uhrbacteria bacterium]
ENYNVGVPLFLFVAMTDALDGSLARIRRQVSEWGIVHDPIADKLLISSVLFVIVLEHINFAIGIALIAVESVMLIGGWYRKVHGTVEPAERWGKLKMATEVVAILILLLALWLRVDLLIDISNGTLALALVFAIVSILVRIK